MVVLCLLCLLCLVRLVVCAVVFQCVLFRFVLLRYVLVCTIGCFLVGVVYFALFHVRLNGSANLLSLKHKP